MTDVEPIQNEIILSVQIKMFSTFLCNAFQQSESFFLIYNKKPIYKSDISIIMINMN